MKEEIIQRIKAADISETDWFYPIFQSITSQYAKGYISRVTEELGNSLSENSEDYRGELLAVCSYDIWK